jgi:paraquat-inducible protein B
MSKKGNPRLIGAFLVGAAILLVVGIIIFGSGKFFQERHRFVAFFPGSVKGLGVGSPVTLEGVKIGEVVDINVVHFLKDGSFHAPVYFEITEGKVLAISKNLKVVDWETHYPDPKGELKALVALGLRARLETQSFVTGQLAISLGVFPNTPANFLGLDKRYEEVPTVPTQLQRLAKTLEDIPFDKIAKNLENAMAGVEELVNSPELKESITSLNQTLKDIGQLAQNLDSQVEPVATSIEDTMRDAQKLVRHVDGDVGPLVTKLKKVAGAAELAIQQAGTTLAAIEDVAGKSSPLYDSIDDTLTDVSAAARSLRVLADYLERNPDALIFGKGKPGGE